MAAYAFDEFVFDDIRYQLTFRGKAVKADTQVLELLAYLLKNPGRVIPKEELIDQIWQGRTLGDNVISVCVAKLRKVLGGPGNRCVGNVYGRGYRFMRTVTVAELPPPSSTPSAAPPAPRPSSSAPESSSLFLGRSEVLGQLEALMERARDGRGGVCALLGEAGIGKTRVAEELEASVRALGVGAAWGHCHPFGDLPPLWPLLQVLRAWGVPLPAAPAEATRGLEEDAEAGDGQSSSWGEQRTDAWHKTVVYMNEMVAKVCAVEPRLIILEDLHWADAATLRLLSHLVRQVAQLPLFILLTVRDTQLPKDESTRRSLDYVLGHRDCSRIKLERLSRQDVRDYSHAMLGTHDDGWGDAIFNKSAGNPFFMVELLRPVVDGRAHNANDLTLSGPVLDIVRQTLQGLGPECRSVLSASAVIGSGFDLGLLSVVTQHGPAALLELLEPAMTSDVIVPERDSHTRFRFGHDLIREALYEDLPNIQRARLHLKVAEGLEQRGLDDPARSMPEIAHHLLAALPAGEVPRAVSYAQRAAAAATHVGANLDACRLLRRALDALALQPSIDPKISCELLYHLATTERAAGEPEFSTHLEQAVNLARHHGLRHILVAAAQTVCGPPGAIASEGAAEILEAALAGLPDNAYTDRAMLLAHLSWTAPHTWDRTRVEQYLNEATQLADNAGTAAKRTTLRAQLYYAGGPDNLEEVQAICRRMENLVTPQQPRQRARWSLEPQIARIIVQLQHGNVDAAARETEVFGRAVHELQHAELGWHYDRMRAVQLMNVGKYEQAREELTALRLRAKQLNLHTRASLDRIDWSELLYQTSTLSMRSVEYVSELRPTLSQGPLTVAFKLQLLCRLGLVAEARTALDTISVERITNLPRSRDFIPTLGHIAFSCIETGHTQLAQAIYELLSPYPHLCIVALSMHCFGPVAQTLGRIAALLGEREAAISHFEMALADSERYGLHPQLARTRLHFAKLLSEGDSAERMRARTLIEQCHTAATRMGMAPLIMAAEEIEKDLAPGHA